jgi:hypothetical protein
MEVRFGPFAFRYYDRLCGFLFLLLAFVAFAQPPAGPPPLGERAAAGDLEAHFEGHALRRCTNKNLLFDQHQLWNL